MGTPWLLIPGNFEKFVEANKKYQAERDLENLLGPRQYKTIKLKEKDWYTCSSCNGTGSYLMTGDLHKSSGWVPCSCSGGLIKTKTIEVKRRVRVKAGSKQIALDSTK